MASLYGVTPTEVAAQLPGLFRGGFGASTQPSVSTVQDLLDAADILAQLEVTEATGAEPNASDNISVLAKKYIVEQVKAQILRIVYVANDPTDADRATKPYEAMAENYRLAIARIGLQGVGTTPEPIERVRGGMSKRDLLIDDTGLGSYTRPNTGGARPF